MLAQNGRGTYVGLTRMGLVNNLKFKRRCGLDQPTLKFKRCPINNIIPLAALRRTKIIATLGPATDDPAVLERLLRAGADLVRVNFSHGKPEDHQRRIEAVRECATRLGHEIGVMADLQGPKLRISRFCNKQVTLQPGQKFILDASHEAEAGNEHIVGIDYKDLPYDVSVGDILLLDDGRIELAVAAVKPPQIICTVTVGGLLLNNKGVNRLGGGLSAKALTEKDKSDLKIAIALGADYIAISFPRNAADIVEARELVRAAGGSAGIIAKIERTEAVAALDEIIKVSDAVMVARGDLGVEIGDAELPGVQKHIIHRARSLDKAVITATQMMESMIHNSIPTRAEVFDVANAVFDGTDAVMLSAETATGEHPDKVIEAMVRICLGAEKQPQARLSRHRMESHFARVDEAIAMGTMYIANHLDIQAIIALTESGSTPLWMSRIRSGIPIFALSRHVHSQRRMTLFRGVYPINFNVTQLKRSELNTAAVATVQSLGYLQDGQLVIMTKGDTMGVHGGANALKILQVGKVF
ncbi:pyruvate kinase [soil metagenome]